MIKIDPTLLKLRTRYDDMPLHLAAYDDKTGEVTKVLLDAYPEGALDVGGSFKRTPLEIAIRRNKSTFVIELLKEHAFKLGRDEEVNNILKRCHEERREDEHKGLERKHKKQREELEREIKEE